MPGKRSRPNPFYVLLLVISTAFVFTCLGYLIAPSIAESAARPRPGGNVPSPASLAAAAWFDRWGVTALAVEVVAMIALGVVAMLSDRWFVDESTKPESGG